jgi:hypothetical protein
MVLSNKKIWIDIEEPKTAIMFNPLINLFKTEGLDIFITARDYDSTFQILNDFKINYNRVGRHGGERLEDKLQTYIDRLKDLFPFVKKFKPDYFVTFSSVEGTRIAYGLKIPSIGYNDEPRNESVCKLIFPFLDNIITPKCVPEDLYIRLNADPLKLIRYNGIDEIGWISEFTPNLKVLRNYDLEKENYIIIRSEPSFASYFVGKLNADETLISQFFPSIYKEFPNLKYFLLVRTEKQELFLRKKLDKFLKEKKVFVTRYLSNMTDLCFYSALVISGGGTIVRESSLLNVPSIEFFPGDTAPQEHFLIQNGFPLVHVKEPEKIVEKSIAFLNQKHSLMRFNLSFKDKIKEFENPNYLCFNLVKKHLLNKN